MNDIRRQLLGGWSLLGLSLVIFVSCAQPDEGTMDSAESNENLTIVSETDEIQGWKSELLSTQKYQGRDAVRARRYSKGNTTFTVEIIDLNLVPQLAAAFPQPEVQNSRNIEWNDEKGMLYSFPNRKAYVVTQHRQDGRFFRISGYGFVSVEEFMNMINELNI
ncbi:MAG: hypothetical protein C4523_15510 [Myxococcales bacterium]|nr:MAG: hypothetical protein C4523_15510 [Myxococcales bacterium]